MNIMMLTTTLNSGGAERVVSRLSSALCSRHCVWVVCTNPEVSMAPAYPIDPAVHVVDLHLPDPFDSNMPWKWAWYIARCRQRRIAIRDLKRKHHTDVCISFLAQPNFDNVRSCRGEKTVISVRNIFRSPVKKYWLWRVMDRFFMVYANRRADRIVTVSKNVGAEQVKLFHADPEIIRPIYNPIDAGAVLDAAKEPAEDAYFRLFRENHDILFAAMGRFEEQKGLHHLIRAFREVHARCPGAGLLMLGQGSLWGELSRLTEESGLSEHVYMTGFQENPFSFLGKTDVFVMASLHEGFSNAALEAMACGLPLILTDCNSGPRELCAPDTDSALHTGKIERASFGILTPVCSGKKKTADEPLEREEKLLAKAMLRMASDPALRNHYAEKSLQRVRDFSTETVLSRWEDLLQELS